MPQPIAIIGGTGAEGFGLALRFARAGAAVHIGSRDLARIVAEEAVRWDKVLKFAGVKPE